MIIIFSLIYTNNAQFFRKMEGAYLNRNGKRNFENISSSKRISNDDEESIKSIKKSLLFNIIVQDLVTKIEDDIISFQEKFS